MARIVTVATLLLALTGCGESTEGGGGPTGPSSPATLLVDCGPLNDGLRCSARLSGGAEPNRDVTAEAMWSASPPGAATFPQPGWMVTGIAADVTLRVQFAGMTNGNPVEYRIAPGTAPRPLTFIGVSALDVARAAIFRARVEIVAGTGAGMSCLTNESGYCSMRNVLLGESLRVRVSADGFEATEREHRVDPFPGTPFLTIQLARRPG